MNNVVTIPITQIDSFTNHPFQVNKDDSLKQLMDSIKQNGLLNPLIVRKKENDRYELISGHRRKLALELLGIKEVNVIIKDLNDDEATIYMVDSNIYREKILPSEKAYAYKMKMDAIKHQGKTTCTQDGYKLTSDPKEPKLSVEKIGKDTGESGITVKRYIRLTYLIPELLKLVDNTVLFDKRFYITMGIKPAVELSYLTKEEQQLVYASIEYEDLTPSHAQTIKIRELSKKKCLDYDAIEKIMSQKKGNQNDQIAFNKKNILDVLPNNLINRDKRYIEAYIIEAIKYYKKQKKDVLNDLNLNALK